MKCMLCKEIENLIEDKSTYASYCKEHGVQCSQCGRVMPKEAAYLLIGKYYCHKCIIRAVVDVINDIYNPFECIKLDLN